MKRKDHSCGSDEWNRKTDDIGACMVQAREKETYIIEEEDVIREKSFGLARIHQEPRQTFINLF